MKWQIQKRKVTVGGNAVLVTPLSRRDANEFREKMAAANGDDEAVNSLVVELVGRSVSFGNGDKVDLDEVPNADLLALFRAVLGGEEPSVADFSGTP